MSNTTNYDPFFNYDPNLVREMAVHKVEVTLGTWGYRRVYVVNVATNFSGKPVLEGALYALLNEYPDCVYLEDKDGNSLEYGNENPDDDDYNYLEELVVGFRILEVRAVSPDDKLKE